MKVYKCSSWWWWGGSILCTEPVNVVPSKPGYEFREAGGAWALERLAPVWSDQMHLRV